MSERSRLRLAILQVLVLSLFGTLLARLYYLQVLAGDEYDLIAQNNNRRELIEPAPRGRLLDVRGRPLATNRSAMVVTVSRAELQKQPDKGRAVLERLSPVVGIPYDDLAKMIQPCGKDVPRPCWRGSPFQPVPVAEDVRPEVAFRIEEHREDFPGVRADLQAVRTYPQRALAGHTLGYVSPISEEELDDPRYEGYRQTALVGRGGLEEQYERFLRGRDGVQTVAVNRLGRVTSVLDTIDPIPGDDVVLALDVDVQKVLERALHNAITRARSMQDRDGSSFKAPAAAGVVLEVRTGRVVGIASLPAYDPSLFIGGISQDDYARLTSEQAGVPLISRATQGLFAPGSTFKIVSTAAAIAAGDASLGGSYPCPGQLRIGNSWKKNFEGRGIPGRISLHTALVESCDTIFYQFAVNEWYGDERRADAKQRPVEMLQRMARAFGFGSHTGIDLPDEAAGRIVDRAFKKDRYDRNKDAYCRRAKSGYPEETDAARRQLLEAIARENCTDGFRYNAGDHANLSIGQGETVVTPLQLAVAYAALVNGGTVYEPRLAKAVVGPDGTLVREIPPKARGKLPVPPEVLAYMRDALAQVPVEGTARGAFAGYPYSVLPVGGKTGTAEVAGKQDTAWFAGFAPANDPQYSVVVMTEQAGQGGRVSAPAVREVIEGIYGIGRAPALPGGRTPAQLPKIAPDGTVTGPRMPPARPLVPPVGEAVAAPARADGTGERRRWST